MDNVHIYLGPPGCGKTQTLRGSAKLNAGQYGAENVVACSFTRAAAAVLQSRDFPLPDENLTTVHSLAYRALGCPTLTQGKEKDFSDQHPQLALSEKRGKRSLDAPYEDDGDDDRPTPGDDLREQMDFDRAHRRPHADINVQRFADAWAAWKAANGLVDFSDLLEQCLADVDEAPGSPACIIFDEAQDSSRLQMDLMLKWGGLARKLILGADPAQAIYTWAGSDPEAIDAIWQALPADRRRTLGQSYRLPRAIHAFAERWFTRQHPLTLHGRDYQPTGTDGAVRWERATAQQPMDVAAQAEAIAAAGKTVMILATCSFQLKPLVACLRARGIPFHNPYRATERLWNPLERGTGPGVKKRRVTALDRILAFLGRLSEREVPGYPAWTQDELWAWLSLLPAAGNLKRGCKAWLTEQKGSASSFDAAELARRAEPALLEWLDTISLASPAEADKAVGQWINRLADVKDKTKVRYFADILRRHGPTGLEEPPRIVVGTCHSCKGGEADVVFLFPDLSPAAWRQWNAGDVGGIVRTLYVGMTRAREELVICGVGLDSTRRLGLGVMG